MWMICDNLKGFFSSRPPLALFLACLGGFTIVLLTLAYQVKTAALRNPDEKDWNDFLNSFKRVQFCVLHNSETDPNSTEPNIPLPYQGYQDVISTMHSNLLKKVGEGELADTATKDPNSIVSISIPLWVQVKPTQEFLSVPHNVTRLTSQLNGKQIGFQNVDNDLDFNVTFTLPYPWNKSMCYGTDDCPIVKIRTCVNFQAPAKLFPNARFPDSGHCEMINTTGGVENHYRLVSLERSAENAGQIVCDNMGMTVTHEEDSSLYIMLTKQDRSLINLHLMHTSYFLFVMVITLFCYGLVKGKAQQKSKPVHYSEVPAEV